MSVLSGVHNMIGRAYKSPEKASTLGNTISLIIRMQENHAQFSAAYVQVSWKLNVSPSDFLNFTVAAESIMTLGDFISGQFVLTSWYLFCWLVWLCTFTSYIMFFIIYEYEWQVWAIQNLKVSWVFLSKLSVLYERQV